MIDNFSGSSLSPMQPILPQVDYREVVQLQIDMNVLKAEQKNLAKRDEYERLRADMATAQRDMLKAINDMGEKTNDKLSKIHWALWAVVAAALLSVIASAIFRWWDNQSIRPDTAPVQQTQPHTNS